jgi:hypothetical protein
MIRIELEGHPYNTNLRHVSKRQSNQAPNPSVSKKESRSWLEDRVLRWNRFAAHRSVILLTECIQNPEVQFFTSLYFSVLLYLYMSSTKFMPLVKIFTSPTLSSRNLLHIAEVLLPLIVESGWSQNKAKTTKMRQMR